ncbi:hypothetical protein JI666_09720 [Bacillus sp. NTK071]|uniref:hypothetical protein n=1 Tax=Bacillus sp. NTK071 TaxID=2802175 RepID=UPI001A8E860E|nr:hypothetical protein [Bacillus sp. NTK071]MBN8209022.1 hypothetical protein [Bacillus sp. NTK071]
MATFLRFTQLILPWISIVFYPKRSFIRYLPVAILASILVGGLSALAVPYKWWRVDGGLKTKIFNDITFIMGPFFIGTLWVFYFTFGHLKRFVAMNLVIDGFFAFVFSYVLEKANVFKLIHFKRIHVFLTYFSFSFILYGFELLINKRR